MNEVCFRSLQHHIYINQRKHLIQILETYHVDCRELLGKFIPDVISCYSHLCMKRKKNTGANVS